MSKQRESNQTEIKQEILQATLQLLETQGIQQVTMRKIASLAEVNGAAINYYFGSKDQVIYEALQTLRSSFGKAYLHLQSNKLQPRDRLIAFMSVYCDTVFAYPNLVKAFVNHSLNSEIEEDYQTFVRQEGLALITNTLAEILPANEETLRMKAFQMMSSMILILLVGRDTGSVIGLDFSDPDVRTRYIHTIVPTNAS